MTRMHVFFLIMVLGSALTLSAGPDSTSAAPEQPVDTLAADTLAVDSLPPIEKMPELKEFVKADYPEDLVKQGIEGAVTLEIVVNDSGLVDSVAVTKGINPRLDSAAARAARAFVFSPAIAGGQPVPVLMEYAYRFSIAEVATQIEQYVNESGRLYERGTRAPILNATIALFCKNPQADTSIKVPIEAYMKKIGSFDGQYLQDWSLITTVDSLGAFRFQSVPSCSVTIKIIAPDYESYIDEVVVKPGEATELVYRLERIAIGDNEIVVYGKAEKKEVAQRTLTLNEVRKIPGLGGDAVKVVQTLPGVARTAFSSGAIIVRGSGSGDSHFYVDGVTIPVLFHFGGLKSTYNSDALESVDLYPGGFGTRYGNALGGVVELKGRKAKTDRFHGYLDANLFDASFLVEGPITDKLSFLASARRSYIADALVLGLKLLNQKLPFTVVPYYWDYLTRFDYKLTNNHHCYVTLFGSQDKLDLIVNGARGGGSSEISDDKDRISSTTTFHLGIAGWDWEIGKRSRNEFRYAACKIKEDDGILGIVTIKGDGIAHYIRDEYSFTASDNLKLHLGADIQIIPYDLDMAFPNALNEIVHDKAHYDLGPYGAYCFLDYKPLPKLTLIPGVRYDYYPELTYDGSVVPEFWNYQGFDNNRGISGEPSFRMTARYETVARQFAKASAGTYNNTPQPMGQAIDKKWGTPTLPAQKGSHYVFGYEWKLTDLVSADVQGYFNQQWDDARTPDSVEVANNPALNDVNFLSNGKARMRGIELLLKHEQGKRFFGWLAYSFSRSERWNYDEDQWSIYSQDQTHILQLISSYKLAWSQELGARLQYVTGNPTTPILGVDYYDADWISYVPQRGPRNSDRVDPYIALDLRYEKKFTYNLWQWYFYLEVLHVENLFGKGYKSPEVGEYIWNYDYSDKIVLSDITRPAFGLKVEF
jgi:TonB family protein